MIPGELKIWSFDLWRGEPGLAPTPARADELRALRRAQSDGEVTVRMASLRGEIVGRFLLLHRAGELTAPLLRAWSPELPDLPERLTRARSAFLADLLVTDGHRRRGVGRALVEDALAVARAAGAERLTLLVRADNAPARRLYQALGFTAAPDATATVAYSLSTGSSPTR